MAAKGPVIIYVVDRGRGRDKGSGGGGGGLRLVRLARKGTDKFFINKLRGASTS